MIVPKDEDESTWPTCNTKGKNQKAVQLRVYRTKQKKNFITSIDQKQSKGEGGSDKGSGSQRQRKREG